MTFQSTAPLEFERAEKEILRHVQGRAFSEELNYPMKPVKKSSRLYKLDPHVIEGAFMRRQSFVQCVLTLREKESDYSPKGMARYQVDNL